MAQLDRESVPVRYLVFVVRNASGSSPDLPDDFYQNRLPFTSSFRSLILFIDSPQKLTLFKIEAGKPPFSLVCPTLYAQSLYEELISNVRERAVRSVSDQCD